MTATPAPPDTPGRPAGWDTARAEACLAPWTAAGILGRFEVQLVTAVLRSAADPPSEDVLLALAVAARATRLGHVCVDLDTVHDQLLVARDGADGHAHPGDLDVPQPDAWAAELATSPIVQVVPNRGAPGAIGPPDASGAAPLRPLILDHGRLYLQRYWAFELEVASDLAARSEAGGTGDAPGGDGSVDQALQAAFGGGPTDGLGTDDLQYVAARRALTRPVTVIAGGPGTGKTHTVARILAAAQLLAAGRGEVCTAALAAPTGKAASRMKDAVASEVQILLDDGRIDAGSATTLLGIEPTTVHRLLGYAGRTAFRHDRSSPLVHDLVIIDETSMVSLPLLARLLTAVRPGARLVLVGDPFQLVSIEAGTVIGDLVGPGGSDGGGRHPLAGSITELRGVHRFEAGSATAALAEAVRDGDADRVIAILAAGHDEVHWVMPDDPAAVDRVRRSAAAAAVEVVEAALTGDAPAALAAATRIKVLCAVRHGPFGLSEWTDRISGAALAAVPTAFRGGRPKVGTPVLVTRNDPVNGLSNGDVGVVVQAGDGRWVAMAGPGEPRRLAPTRLGEWEAWWAMTVHKSQGSEFPHAVVSLPTVDSPILTRELLYTAVTRAKPEVTVVGSEETVRRAVGRSVARASGLRRRLWGDA